MIERCNAEIESSVHFKLKEESEESARKAVAYFRIGMVTATSHID
jgi:hypothetical protein